MLLVSTLVTIVFVAYLAVAGVPMTQARNQYNAGYRAFQRGYYEQAETDFKQSLQTWWTPEADNALQLTQKLLNGD
jgi:hypothetical protein